jgi:hypothetical protein
VVIETYAATNKTESLTIGINGLIRSVQITWEIEPPVSFVLQEMAEVILIAKNSVRNTTTAQSHNSRDGSTMGRLGGEMSLPSKPSGSGPYRWKSQLIRGEAPEGPRLAPEAPVGLPSHAVGSSWVPGNRSLFLIFAITTGNDGMVVRLLRRSVPRNRLSDHGFGHRYCCLWGRDTHVRGNRCGDVTRPGSPSRRGMSREPWPRDWSRCRSFADPGG